MNLHPDKMIDVKMLLDITPSVGLPVASYMATGSQIMSFVAAFLGIVYTIMRMFSWIDERRKLKGSISKED